MATFEPIRPTDLEDVEPPRTEQLIPVFRRLWEACMERGLPIGLAPNIHVSLVLLPEECRGFSDRSYPWQSLKLKALDKVFGAAFERRLARKAGRPRRAAAAL